MERCRTSMSSSYIVNGILSRKRNSSDHYEEVSPSTSTGEIISKPVVRKSSSNDEHKKYSLVDPVWETLDPTPDVHALFLSYDDMFFGGTLGGCEVKWSSRMTSCAGICSYEGRGGLCSIRLSKPLLILRPRRDLVETLLHEMIHAYLFVTVRDRDRDGHGVRFQYHMHRINKMAGTHITIYHRFFAEVANYKQHWWRCDGPCQSRRPYFGWVKRASNRAPGPNDFWWKQHKQSCGGMFIKVKEPVGYTDSKKKKRLNSASSNEKVSKEDGTSRILNLTTTNSNSFCGKGYVLGSAKSKPKELFTKKSKYAANRSIEYFFQKKETTNDEQAATASHTLTPVNNLMKTDDVIVVEEITSRNVSGADFSFVFCPSCNSKVLKSTINSHLDLCLTS